MLVCLSGASAQIVVLDSISLSGHEKTKEKVILRELSIQKGDTLPFSSLATELEKSQQNIYNLAIFTKVKLQDSIHWTAPSRNIGRLVLYIDVQERWYIWPTPYLAFEERTFNEWWQDKDLDRLVYGMGVVWDNFSGMNDRLTAYGQLGYSRRVNLLYTRPFLFGKSRLDGSFGFRYLNNKEVGYTTEQGILQLARLDREPIRHSMDMFGLISRRFSPRSNLTLTLRWQWFRPNDSLLYFNDRYLTTAGNTEHYPSIGIGYLNDQRDIRSFPLKGYKIAADVIQSGFPGVGTTRFTKLSLSFSHHIPIAGSKWFNFAYGTENFLILGDRVPYFDKFFVGFLNYLRGYEPFVIDGSFVHMSKAEFKVALFPRKMLHAKWIPLRKFRDFPLGVYLSAFADAGYVRDDTFNNLDPYLKDKWLSGYGFGLNLITVYDFLIRLEYSTNHLGQSGIYLNTLVSIR